MQAVEKPYIRRLPRIGDTLRSNKRDRHAVQLREGNQLCQPLLADGRLRHVELVDLKPSQQILRQRLHQHRRRVAEVIVMAENHLVLLLLSFSKEGHRRKPKIRRLGQDREDAARVLVRADNHHIPAVNMSALPLHNQLARQVFLHQQQQRRKDPAGQQHQPRHRQPMQINTQRHQSEAKNVHPQNLGRLAYLQQTVRVLVQLTLVRKKHEDQDILE